MYRQKKNTQADVNIQMTLNRLILRAAYPIGSYYKFAVARDSNNETIPCI